MSCCPDVIAFLASIGCVHAARMHRPGALKSVWRADDWLAHFAEEERYLFPLLPEKLRSQLILEHMLLKRELETTGRILSMDVLRAHSDAEDIAVRALITAGSAHAPVATAGIRRAR
jgi:iron-sulfur cluster repair protein YtfE (RIC family)